MPRTKTGSPPSYRVYKRTGQAVVTIDGHDHYLGEYGSLESRQKYNRLIAAWLARQRQAESGEPGGEPVPEVGDALSVNEVILAYVRHASAYYKPADGGERKELGCIRDALRVVKQLFGRTPAAEFGPRALKAVRVEMLGKDWSRGYVNHQVNRVRRMFRWATEEELIPPAVHHALQAVRGLRKGLPGVRESRKVRPAPVRSVKEVLKRVRPVVRAMILFQVHTGCRPGEVCRLKPRRVDRASGVWVYRPRRHKTAHHGKRREILIGPRAQKVLGPWLRDASPDEYVFSPARAEAVRQAERRAGRKTPLWPSHLRRQAAKRKADPKRGKRDRYDVASYRRAIKRACDLAFPPPAPLARREGETPKEWAARLTAEQREELRRWRKAHRWAPNQLRHTAATRIRKRYGIETARIILGHSTAFTTEIYAETDERRAAEAMAEMG
jgi:integrase